VEPPYLTADRGQGLRVEERLPWFLRRSRLQAVQAEIVPSPLQDRELWLSAEQRREGLRQARQVAVDELALQRDRGRGHHHRGVLDNGVPDGGHEISKGLAGTRPGLHGKMLTSADRPFDRPGHLHLAGPLR